MGVKDVNKKIASPRKEKTQAYHKHRAWKKYHYK
jgi:hypothetical protein